MALDSVDRDLDKRGPARCTTAMNRVQRRSEVPVFAHFDDPAAAFGAIRGAVERVLNDPERQAG